MANVDDTDAGVGLFKRKHSAGKGDTTASSNPVIGLGDHRLEYNMKHARRGICALINNKNFERSTGQNRRDGTEVDAEQVEASFRRLGFDVLRFDDLSCRSMVAELRQLANADHKEHDCFACVILSHGLLNKIYGIDGTVSVEQLVAPFKGDVCKSLRGKPKLFFIQACRGQQFDRGIEQSDAGGDEMDAGVHSRKLPVEADFFMAYSTVPGFYSWRNNQDGSWFIQCLTRVIREHGEAGTLELHHLMIVVNRLVASEFESCTDQQWTDRMKQMPSIVSMLTKLLYFRNKEAIGQ